MMSRTIGIQQLERFDHDGFLHLLGALADDPVFIAARRLVDELLRLRTIRRRRGPRTSSEARSSVDLGGPHREDARRLWCLLSHSTPSTVRGSSTRTE